MKSIEEGKKLIQSAYTMAAVAILLIGINLFTYSGNFWAIYPIFFMAIGLLFNGVKYMGHKASERFEEQQLKKKQDKLDELELKQLETMKRTNNGAWNEKDFV